MDERLRFIRDAQSDRYTMSALCARYGVSRRIGYKWLARYDAEGPAPSTAADLLARRGLVPPF
jgi:putative transposase